VISGLFAGIAAADGTASEATPETETAAVPEHCKMYTVIPADARDSGIAWNQLLSFAACVQDTSVYDATKPDELGEVVSAMAATLAPSLTLYLHAIEHGPGPVQLRAAYHVGMTYVAMVTRARASLVAPPEVKKSEAAAANYRVLHARLETALAPVLKAARMTFMVIIAAADADPSIAGDEMTKRFVAEARKMLELLPDVSDEQLQYTRT
jgi:hypothetical protein